MMRAEMSRKCYFPVLIIVFALILSFPSICQSKYYWYNITVPFQAYKLHKIVSGSIVIIEVDIPDFIKNYEEIPLIIDAEGGSPAFGVQNTKILTVNDEANYRFVVPIEREVTCRVNIKTKDLKKGINKLQFKGSGTSIESGYSIKRLSLDISALENFQAYLKESTNDQEKKQSTETFKQDNSPPEITITSHDTSRGIETVEYKKKVKITGLVIDKSGIVEIIVNNKEATFDVTGNFEADVYLGLGENEIFISTMDRFENRAYKSFTIIRKDLVSEEAKETRIITPDRYYALIIGNNNYRYLRKLQTAIKDAQAVENLLKNRFGFRTTLLIDVGRDEIIRSINNFRRKLKNNDNFLIYYAGHGEFDKTANKAYWLPVDARRDDDTEWIIADTITSNIKRIASNHIIIVSDSCYSGTFTRRSITDLTSAKNRSRYLEKMRKKRSRTLLASGGNEPVSDIGGEGHSVFAKAFIQGLSNMERDEFTAEELYYLHIKELVAGGSEQTPEYNIIRNSGHMGGDFYFRRIK
jgi:hypothetical protein